MQTRTQRIKTILGIYDNSKDAVILECLNLQSEAILAYLGLSELPIQAEFVLIETSIARFNQRGYEGLESENVDSIQKRFTADILAPYKSFLDNFKEIKPKIRLL